MKYLKFLIVFAIVSCQGSLSDEQRNKIKEEMKNSKITRVTEVQITEAAFEKGRALVDQLQKVDRDQVKIDSLAGAEQIPVRWLTPDITDGHPIEIQMLEAYSSTDVSQLQDNVQKIRNDNVETDSLLYTKPVVAEGLKKLDGVWSIWLSRKKLVMGMKK
jgi:hypothetical protein